MNIVPAVNGLHWLRIGWQLFLRNPLMWILCFAAQTVITLLLAQLPLLGGPLAMLIAPAFSAGFLSLGDAAEKNRPLEPALLFAGFRLKAGPLLGLGGLYLIGGALLIVFSTLLGGGLPTADTTTEAPTQSEALGLIIWLLLFVLLHMAFWFAPALVFWQNMAPLKSLFFSFFACWRNWRAFGLYALMLFLFVSGAVLLFSPLITLLFGEQIPAEASARNFLFAFILGLMPMLLASIYVSYRDVFTAST